MKTSRNIQTILRRLAEELRPFRGTIIFSVIARFLNQFSGVLILLLAGWGLGQVLLNPHQYVLSHTMVELVVLGALKGIFFYLENYTGYSITLNLQAEMRNKLYQRLELLAPAGLAGARSGDIISRAIADVNHLEVFFERTIAPTIVAALVGLFGFFVMLAINIWLALIFLLFLAGAGVALPWWFERQGTEESLRLRTAAADVNAHLVDSVQGLREIMVFGYGERRVKEIQQHGERLEQAQGAVANLSGRQRGLADLVTGLCILLLFLSGLLLHNLEVFNVIYLPAALALAYATFRPVLAVSNVIPELNEGIASASRLFRILDQAPVVHDIVTEPPPEPVEPSIHFDEVAFRYPSINILENGKQIDESPWVHNGMSFDIPAGKTVALVGASGVGKTTVVNLLMRFWDTSQGQIRIGGYDVRDFPMEELRSKMAVVSQKTYIFNTTIKENFLVGNSRASDDEIQQVAEAVGIHDFIASLPDGYDTSVGEMGASLSGGQQQRIAIARALLKNAPILVLDEATSSLDSASERNIQMSIQQLMQGRTTLIIAHRLSTIINADQILVMESGRIVERGKHSELLALDGVYARLFSRQQDAQVSSA